MQEIKKVLFFEHGFLTYYFDLTYTTLGVALKHSLRFSIQALVTIFRTLCNSI